MVRVYVVLSALFMLCAAISSYHSKILESFYLTHWPVNIVMHVLPVLFLLGLILIRWIMFRLHHPFHGPIPRAILKMVKYSLSALLYLVLFKTGAKSVLFKGLKPSINNLKHTVSGLSIENTIIEEIFEKLDWQFTNTKYLLFIDLGTLLTVIFLSLVFLCIGRIFNDDSRLFDWLFDLFTDVALQMTADVFGRHLWSGFGCYLFLVALVGFKEYTNYNQHEERIAADRKVRIESRGPIQVENRGEIEEFRVSHGEAPHATQELQEVLVDHGEAPHATQEPQEVPVDHGEAPHATQELQEVPVDHGEAPHATEELQEVPVDHGEAPHTTQESPEVLVDHGEAPHATQELQEVPVDHGEAPHATQEPQEVLVDHGEAPHATQELQEVPVDHGEAPHATQEPQEVLVETSDTIDNVGAGDEEETAIVQQFQELQIENEGVEVGHEAAENEGPIQVVGLIPKNHMLRLRRKNAKRMKKELGQLRIDNILYREINSIR